MQELIENVRRAGELRREIAQRRDLEPPKEWRLPEGEPVKSSGPKLDTRPVVAVGVTPAQTGRGSPEN